MQNCFYDAQGELTCAKQVRETFADISDQGLLRDGTWKHDLNCPGNDLGGPLDIPDMDTCKDVCRRLHGCGGISYNSRGKKCWPKFSTRNCFPETDTHTWSKSGFEMSGDPLGEGGGLARLISKMNTGFVGR